jgi:zinc protease
MSQFLQRKAVRRTISLSMSSLFLGANLLTGLAWSSADMDVTPQIHEVTLRSGQQVYVEEIHSQPIVTIDTWVNTGSAQENAENNGVSHFLEHLLFKGTDKYKVGEIDKMLESRGAEFNAATSDDFTHFHITTSTPYLAEALNLHADMLLNATINTPELDRERKVVQEEINRALDNPPRKSFMALSTLLFENHPYAMDTLGPKTRIQTLPRETILNYYHKWYQPQNFKTVIVGDIKTDQAVAMVENAFQKAYISHTRPTPGVPTTEPILAMKAPKSMVLADPNLSATELQFGFLAPPVSDRDDNYALDIASMVLGQGTSSRLHQHLKEEKQLVDSIGADNDTRRQSGVFEVAAEVKSENRQAAKKAIIEEINRFKQEGPTAEELEKAKTQVIKQFAFATESTEGVAESIGLDVTIAKLSDYTEYVDNIQKVTAEQVKAAVQKYVNFDKAALVEMIPGKTVDNPAEQISQNIALLHQAAKAELATRVASKTQTAESAIEKLVLPNGATVLLKPSPQTKTVAITLFAKGGWLAEPKPGVAALTGRMLLKGTKNRSAEEISQELERMGLSISTSSAEDYMQIDGMSVSQDFGKLLFVLEDVLTNPTFPQSEITKERADMLEEIKTNRDQPSNLMFERLTEALYREHPYGAVGDRLEASLPTVTQDDIVNFYHQEFCPQNIVVSVVGNFDPQVAKTSLQQLFSYLPSDGSMQTAHFQDVTPLKASVESDAQKPEQAASWIAYGWLTPGISTSRDFITLKVINAMLGSGLSSRLFVDLREKQGLAYHVSTLFPSRLEKSNFVMYIGTDPKNMSKVTAGFNQEIKRLQTEPVSTQELDNVKSKLIGMFELGHESNTSQATFIGLYETLGVGYGYDRKYPDLVKQVTSQDIQRVANQYFSQPKVVSIVAPKVVRGDASSSAN